MNYQHKSLFYLLSGGMRKNKITFQRDPSHKKYNSPENMRASSTFEVYTTLNSTYDGEMSLRVSRSSFLFEAGSDEMIIEATTRNFPCIKIV